MGRRCVSVPRPPSSRVVVYQHRARARGSVARGTADERRSTFPIPPLCAAVVTARRWQRRAARGCTGRQEQRVGEGGRGGGRGTPGAQRTGATCKTARTAHTATSASNPASRRIASIDSKCQSSKKGARTQRVRAGPYLRSRFPSCAPARRGGRGRGRDAVDPVRTLAQHTGARPGGDAWAPPPAPRAGRGGGGGGQITIARGGAAARPERRRVRACCRGSTGAA